MSDVPKNRRTRNPPVRFQPGNPGSPGRPVGTRNFRSQQVQEMARGLFTPDVWQQWAVGLSDGTLPVPLVQTLLYYAYGKPQERIEVTTVTDQPTDVLVQRMRDLVAQLEPIETAPGLPADTAAEPADIVHKDCTTGEYR